MALGDDRLAFGVGLEHDRDGPPHVHARYDLAKHLDDVFHRGVVVVVQDDLVGRLSGELAFGSSLGDGLGRLF